MELPENVAENVENAPFRSSPAAVAIQDGNAVRRILQQRSNRGMTKKVKLERTKKEPEVKTSKLGKAKRSTAKGRKKPIGKTTKGFYIPYESTIQVLRILHEESSNLVLPRTMVIPDDEKFPKEWHGVDVAGTVYDMKWWQRHVKQKPDRVAELNMLGFVWERLQPEWNLVLEGLVTYGILYGDLLVPSKFVIPHNDKNWPKALWGLTLGNSVNRIRSRGDFLRGPNSFSRRDQLDRIGFVWDPQEERFQKFCIALRAFGRIEQQKNGPKKAGALKVPSTFVIPHDDGEWPKNLWGYKLGVKCSQVRQKELYVKGHPDRLKVLADIGFQFGGNDSLSWLEVVHAAAIYSQMNNRQLEVPQSFVVPAPPKMVSMSEGSSGTLIAGSDEAWPWPGKFRDLLCQGRRVIFSMSHLTILETLLQNTCGAFPLDKG